MVTEPIKSIIESTLFLNENIFKSTKVQPTVSVILNKQTEIKPKSPSPFYQSNTLIHNNHIQCYQSKKAQ